MPLYSEHISNMYYSGAPSYTSPSYGYKSSFTPLGTSYSASYLSPGGSYSKHSSLSSYSRAPLSSRWIPGMSRSYSPLLTPISERGTASPIRINSPRRIPIAQRCYGTPSYIQRPININTESIDVSRDRYRPKTAEPSAKASSPPPQRDDPVKVDGNCPFMPRVDGKPVTGIDSSPGIQRSTIKRGRTVVRLHTIKRKEKDSPRKPTQLQNSEANKQDVSETSVDDIVPEEPKESLSWRDKLSEDLVYVDKKEKKSLGTKLVEKFLVKDITENDNLIKKSATCSDIPSQIAPRLMPDAEMPSTSKSPDRRCSVELLAEQASLLDSLIRGENLSTATLDLSKIGIADESKNKFASSDSIKRKKTDDDGNPLKTTKSDHSLHENLKKSIRSNKDSKILTKRRSLKKSHSGGSICRLDSITEFPKEPKDMDLPAIQENRFSPKEEKIEKTPKLRTKITTSVEISPPTSPLKFRIENITVEEKHHMPKKEVSFSYEMDETPTQAVTLQGPKTTLRRTKERNSVKKKSKNIKGTEPISPEPDDGNFWAKIGKRETVYLMKRKQNIEEAREKNKRSFLWFPENEEANDVSNDTNTCKSDVLIDKSNDSLSQGVCLDLPLESESNKLSQESNIHFDENVNKNLNLKSSNDRKTDSNSDNTSLEEKIIKAVVELKNDELIAVSNKSPTRKLLRQDAEIKEKAIPKEEPGTGKTTDPQMDDESKINILNTVCNNHSVNEISLPLKKVLVSYKTSSLNTESAAAMTLEANETEICESSMDLVCIDADAPTYSKTTENNTSTSQIRSKSEGNILGKEAKSLSQKNIDSNKSTIEGHSTPKMKLQTSKTRAKSEGKSFEKKLMLNNSEKNKSTASTTQAKSLSENKELPLKTQAISEVKSLQINPKLIPERTAVKMKGGVDVNLATETFAQVTTVPIIKTIELKPQVKNEGKNLEKDSKPILEKTETTDMDKPSINLCPEISVQKKTDSVITAPIPNIDRNENKTLAIKQKDETTGSVSDADITLSTKPEAKSEKTLPLLQTTAKGKVMSLGDKDLKTVTKKIETIKSSKSQGDLSSEIETKSIKIEPTLKIQDKSKQQSLDKKSEIISKPESAKAKVDVLSTKSKEKIKIVSSLQTQAKNKIEQKNIEQLLKNKPVKSLEDAKSNVKNTVILENTKSNLPEEKPETSLKKKANATEGKAAEKKIETKPEKISSTPKENICQTCKKTLVSDSSKIGSVTSSKEPSISKQVKDKVIIFSDTAENPANIIEEDNSGLDSTVTNQSNSNIITTIGDSSSQTPVVIETKNIPNETVASDTKQVLKVPSQKTIGEENKSEKITNEDDSTKQPSLKDTEPSRPVKPIKEEKAVKPLIATPRPLKKRAPQVIHSDSSDSSSEEDSSEEEDSETSEEGGEFYECENNPDGRTSTGSNDSGFDSSAPTSPATFLQIKKGGVDSPGPSSSNATSQLPASASDVDASDGDSELELEQSTAYGIFRKTGRFTPPARSIPRFRKYNIEDFQFIKVLGKGSFGKVLLAELRDTEYYYAVKCLKKDVVLEDDDVECTLIERKVLALGTNHPYLCHLFATFQTDSHLFFVMEYLNGGDLMFHIQQSGRFPEARARFYAAEIVSGLKFLHKRGIVYRDLKLDNILLDFDGHVRIADFGMCKLQIYLDKTADTFCGTPDYMAPEIIKGLKYNQTVDWWSFGVLLYEMLIGQSPFSGCDEDELFWSICNEMPSYPRFLSREALTILTRLLDKDARTRLGGTECMHGDVREQEFFRPVHWDKLERRELETPFKPRVRHPLDTQYFDRAFTGERPRLTAVEPHVLRSMDQEPFRGFSYTNPNATDR